MLTTDFKDFGNFYKNEEGIISFVSLAEEQLFRESNFINNCGFEKFDSDIHSAFLESKNSIYDLVNITKALKFIDIPVSLKGFEFPTLLNIKVKENSSMENSFPLSQVAKAVILRGIDFVPFETENRLILTDYGSKMPSKGDIVVFPTVVKGYKTVYPKSFDSWVKLLLKAKEFKTVNKEFLMLKSLFSIK